MCNKMLLSVLWYRCLDLAIYTDFFTLILRQNSMIFEGNPNSLTESYFTGELRLGES